MDGPYTIEEAIEIERCYAIVADAVNRLHSDLGSKLHRSYLFVQQEVRDSTFAKVLVVEELLRGINKDQRWPVSSDSFIISSRLEQGLRRAHHVGMALAPFALRDTLGFLRKKFRREPPHFGCAAKEAIMRCKMTHASSQNRNRTIPLSQPGSMGSAAPAEPRSLPHRK
jgi:hypothetical protein